MNFSLANMNATAEYLDNNTTNVFDESQIMSDYSEIIIYSVIFVICCVGVPLNGIVIWLLGFQIKRNPFTMLILNLAIADFGFIAIWAIVCIFYLIHLIHLIRLEIPLIFLIKLSQILYSNDIFLLTAISIDRYVAVFFPIWHRCSRPKHLSPAICALLWICSFLLVGIQNIIQYVFNYEGFPNLHLIVTLVLTLPLITISTLILFIKIYLKPKQFKRRQLLVTILITLLYFFILTLPLHIYVFSITFFDFMYWRQFPELGNYLILGASLNSSINPVIYYLVGRKKRARTRESIKVISERLFREHEALESTENATNLISTPL